MAFTGIHVACSYAGANGDKAAPDLAVLRAPVWSQALTSAGTTTNSAPAEDQGLGDPVFTIRAVGAAWWVSIGPAPGDPASGASPSLYIADGDIITVRASPLDKVRGATA